MVVFCQPFINKFYHQRSFAMLYLLRLTTTKPNDVFVWAYKVHTHNNTECGLLKCLQSPYRLLGTTREIKEKEHELLMYYINHPNKKIHAKDIREFGIEITDSNYLSKKRGSIKDKFFETARHLTDKQSHHSIGDDIFKKGLHEQSNITIFDFEIAKISEEIANFSLNLSTEEIFDDKNHLLKLYEKWSNAYQLHTLEQNTSTSSLISYLAQKYPNEIKNLYHLDDVILPFIVPKNNSVNFPMIIENKAPYPRETVNSLLEQRKILNATLYNGSIYRLLTQNQETHQLTLGCCGYFDTLDSADYLSSRLKFFYQKHNNLVKQPSKELIDMENLWKKRMSEVLKGDFSHFNSGFGFSLPIFKILKDGGLELLCTQSSQQKAIWASKKQVFPSGTLEYWSPINNKKLTFNNFKSIATKELFEESLLGNSLINKKIISQFPALQVYLSMLIDKDNPEEMCVDFDTIDNSTNNIIKMWDKIWSEIKEPQPSLESLLTLKNAKNSTQAFLIVDALNFRPEIVFPLYIQGELNKVVNWEHDHTKLKIISWKNISELNIWLKDEYGSWATPSLAAAYLGAKQYFETQDKSIFLNNE